MHSLVKIAQTDLDSIQKDIDEFCYVDDLAEKAKEAQCHFQKGVAFKE